MRFGWILHVYDFCMKLKIPIFICPEIGIFDCNTTKIRNSDFNTKKKIGISDFIAHHIPVNTI